MWHTDEGHIVDYERARQVLGTAKNASVADIERAFRKLALTAHPDRGGQGERMAELLEARDTLLQSTTGSASTALVTSDTMQSLAVFLQKTSQNAALTVEMVEITNKIQSKSVNRLKHFRLAAAIAAAIFAGAGFIGKEAPKQLFSYEEDITEEQTRLMSLKDAKANFEKTYAEAEKDYLSSHATWMKNTLNAQHALASKDEKATQVEEQTLSREVEAARGELNRLTHHWLDQRFTIVMKLKQSVDDSDNVPSKGNARVSPDDRNSEIERLLKDIPHRADEMLQKTESKIKSLKKSQAYVTNLWQGTTFALACVCGLLSALFTLSIRRIELTFDELNDQLSSKTMAHRIIREAFEGSIPSQWSIIDLADAIDKWSKQKSCPYRHLASVVGPFSLAQYIAGRAKQAELLEIFEEMREGEYLELYSVKSPA